LEQMADKPTAWRIEAAASEKQIAMPFKLLHSWLSGTGRLENRRQRGRCAGGRG
jgi:hypothetical protein